VCALAGISAVVYPIVFIGVRGALRSEHQSLVMFWPIGITDRKFFF